MSLPPGPPSFNIHTDKYLKYCPVRLDHHLILGIHIKDFKINELISDD
jgi:hypothetical protein